MAKKLEEDRNRKESDEKVPAETFFLVIDVDKAIKENQDKKTIDRIWYCIV